MPAQLCSRGRADVGVSMCALWLSYLEAASTSSWWCFCRHPHHVLSRRLANNPPLCLVRIFNRCFTISTSVLLSWPALGKILTDVFQGVRALKSRRGVTSRTASRENLAQAHPVQPSSPKGTCSAKQEGRIERKGNRHKAS